MCTSGLYGCPSLKFYLEECLEASSASSSIYTFKLSSIPKAFSQTQCQLEVVIAFQDLDCLHSASIANLPKDAAIHLVLVKVLIIII